MRLTEKNEFFEYALPEKNNMGDKIASEVSICQDGWTADQFIVGEAINHFGELEDVLEKWHIENLDKFIEEQIAKKRELNDILWKMEQELAELKQKAIVPKFEIGQEVWAISVYRKDCVDNFIIQEICFCSCYGLYYKTNMDIDLFEYYFDIFATKEEAEAKLKELKGEK